MVPYYDLETTSGLCNYIRDCLDQYSRNPQDELTILEKLRVVFGNSEYQKKVLNSYLSFTTVFREKVEEKAVDLLKYLLLKIDAGSYASIAGVLEISRHVRDLLEKYSKNPGREEEVLKNLKDIFFDDSKTQRKVLDGNEFCRVFKQTIGKRRISTLKLLLLKIDESRYANVNWNWS